LTISEISNRTEKGRFCVTNPATTISYVTPSLTRYLPALRLFQRSPVATTANTWIQIEAIKVPSVIFENRLQSQPHHPAFSTPYLTEHIVSWSIRSTFVTSQPPLEQSLDPTTTVTNLSQAFSLFFPRPLFRQVTTRPLSARFRHVSFHFPIIRRTSYRLWQDASMV
jgi:hypothetical protein